MAKKCPLCQGKVEQGYCISCGYKVPDESEIEDLTSRYSLNPDEEQPAFIPYKDASVRITPDIKVAGTTRPQPYTAPQTPHRNFDQATNNTAASQWNNTRPQQTNNTGWQNGTGTQNGNVTPGVPYSGAGSRQNSGWQNGTGVQNNANQNTGSGNNVPFEPYQQNVYTNNGSYSTGEKGFIAQRWWMILVAVLVPILGFIFAATLKTNYDPEAKKLQKILIIISIIRIFLFPFIS